MNGAKLSAAQSVVGQLFNLEVAMKDLDLVTGDFLLLEKYLLCSLKIAG